MHREMSMLQTDDFIEATPLQREHLSGMFTAYAMASNVISTEAS